MSTVQAGCERCYTVIDPKSLQAVILSSEPQEARSHLAELMEISPIGARLRVRGASHPSPDVRIVLASANFEGALIIPAKVCCVLSDSEEARLVDCTFDPPLADDSFQRLLDSGLLERRAAPREEVCISVYVQWEPAAPWLPAVVRNISEGGVCLLMHQPPGNVGRAWISLSASGSGVRIPLEVRFSRNVGSDYFVGCQFTQPDDFAVLRDAQSHADAADLRSSRRGV